MTENIRIISMPYLFLAGALLVGQQVMAATVYQWTDEEGVVHFSDVAPNDDMALDIDEIEFNSYASNDVDPNEYSISNQLERMTEWRRQTTEERLAKKQLQLEEKRLAQERDSYQYYNSPSTSEYYSESPYYYYSLPVYASRPRVEHYHVPGYATPFKQFNNHGYSGRHHFNGGIRHSGISAGHSF